MRASLLLAALVAEVAGATALLRGVEPSSRAAFPSYVLDSSWPVIPASLNISSITAVAVMNASATQKEIHVAQRGTAAPPMVVFSESGQFLRSYGTGVIKTPHGCESDPGVPSSLWVTDVGTFTVKKLDITGNMTAQVGTPGVAGSGIDPAQFQVPADIGLVHSSSDNYLVVSDGDGAPNNRVLVLQPSGNGNYTVAFGIGGNGTGPGEFSSPHSVTVFNNEQIAVADRGNKRVQFFSASSGLFLGEWTGAQCLTSITGGGTPWGIRFFGGNAQFPPATFIADGDHGVVFVLTAPTSAAAGGPGPCKLMQTLQIGVSNKPHELAVDQQTGAVYLAGVGTPATLQRWLPSGGA